MIQYHCNVDLLFDVSPDAFYPPPKVDSSIVTLRPHTVHPYPVKDYALLEAIVRDAFNQRRKTLRNSLKAYVDADTWNSISISPMARAETLSVNDFVMIANTIVK
jgi:16S rRNA (adenine1518-N6/adenine1519-N6)-dimethyltransferase